MDLKRKLLWWQYIESEVPQLFGWNFLLINESREIGIIKDKLCYALEKVDEKREIDSGLIFNSGGLHYDLFTLYSPTINLDFRKVYGGLVEKDRKLYRRKTIDGWNNFMDKIVCGNV